LASRLRLMDVNPNNLLSIEEQQRMQRAAVVKIYNYYRILLAFLMLFLFLQAEDQRWVGVTNPEMFQTTVLVYLAVNIIIGVVSLFLDARYLNRTGPVFAILTLDIIGLTLMMSASGGVTSGLGNFLIFNAAFAGGLISGRVSTVIPAIAFILCVYDEFYLFFRNISDAQSFFQAGLLGIVLFTANILFQYLSRQLRERESEVFSLEKLNQMVINRMRIGVVVVSEQGQIHLLNNAAQAMLGGAIETQHNISLLPENFKQQLEAWKQTYSSRLVSFKSQESGPEILAQISQVTPNQESDYLIFLEDSTDIQQQAQQLKLAALGRLSASIAHEVRNPLGAISHAAQLLGESDELNKGDKRLTEIIHNHCIRMNGVIENVLQMSRRKSAQPELIELHSWLDHFVTEFCAGNQINPVIDIQLSKDDLTIQADPLHLSQILSNLCQNGLRYSLKHGGVEKITIKADRDPLSQSVYLEVIDYGPGVSQEQVQNLFEPFYTTESTGTGLGLYLSKELCEANRARLTYRRGQHGGSCFRISFA
jgi:two-component system sensor histidine kinase PilS (NtrC family)